MSNMLFDSFHSGLGQVLDLRSAQHALTTANLANVDTPEYRAKSIAFDRVLSEIVDRTDRPELSRSRSGHLPGLDGDSRNPDIEEMEPPAWAADGNSVQLERETVRLTENALMYEAVSTGLSKRLAMLRFAAADGRTG
jgi:flagellar basal-body rod protein FlgB